MSLEMTQKTTKHLYDHTAETHFRAKLLEFHDQCKTHLVMCGVGEPGCDLQTIKMAPLRHDRKYCQRLMGGMLHHKPNIHITLHDEQKNIEFELMVTELIDHDKYLDIDMTGVFLYQAAHEYPEPGKCLYQFWSLHDKTDIDEINRLWNES